MPNYQITNKGGDEYSFVLRAGNRFVLLISNTYFSKAACMNGIESVRENGSNADRFKIHETSRGWYYFTLSAANGVVIGKSQTYASKQGLQNGIESVKKHSQDTSEPEYKFKQQL